MLKRSILRDKEGHSESYLFYNYDQVNSWIIEYLKKDNINIDIPVNTQERILACVLDSKTNAESFRKEYFKFIRDIIVNFNIKNPVGKILDAMLKDSECNSNVTTYYCSKYIEYQFIDSMNDLFTISKENNIEIPQNAIEKLIEIICTKNNYINLYTKNDEKLYDLALSLKHLFRKCKQLNINYDYQNAIDKLKILFNHENQKEDFTKLQDVILSLNSETNYNNKVSSNIASANIESQLKNVSL